MWQYIIFLSLKELQVTSDLILNFMKTNIEGATTQKYQKKYKNHDIFNIDAPPGTPGVSKDAPLSTKQAHGGLVCKY